MKTIIATVAAAAVITAGASVAGAQELGGSTGGVSPYVGFEYVTTPTADTAAAGAEPNNDATWWGGARSATVLVGAEAALPWDLKVDGSISVANEVGLAFSGFAIDGASLTVSYEVMDGMDIYSTTEFDNEFARESTSLGMLWKF